MLPLVIALVVGVGGLGWCAIFLLQLAARSEAGEFERSYLVGVRSRATLVSDEAWREGHRAAAPSFRVAGVGLLVGVVGILGLVLCETGLFGEFSSTALMIWGAVVALSSCAWVLWFAIRASVRGHRAAAKMLGWNAKQSRMRFSDWFIMQ